LLKDFGVVGGPSAWLAILWLVMGTTAAKFIGSKGFASAEASNHLTVDLLLQFARANVVKIGETATAST